MKKYSPGANKDRDFYHICDCCEIDDGRSVLLWTPLPKRKGHFALCYECLNKLFREYISCKDKFDGTVIVKRAVIPEALRNKIFERDGFNCVKCGSTSDLTIDHIIPFSRGGQTTEDNLQTLCLKCNIRKGNR